MPTDVRKAFGLPGSAFRNLAATPQFLGRSPNRGRLDGSAERFRTSDGGAAALLPELLRPRKFNAVPNPETKKPGSKMAATRSLNGFLKIIY